MKGFVFQFLLFAFLLFGSSLFAADVLSFSPQGDVKDIKQVVVKFKTEMVAMGDPKEGTDIFDIKCIGGDGQKISKLTEYSLRWADGKTWILDFSQPLDAGINCEFKLKYDVVDLAKTSFVSKMTYFFGTGGPRIVDYYPNSGSRIENDQYFIIRLDGSIDLASLLKLAYFEIQGLNEKIKIKVVDGKVKEETLNFAIDRNYDWYELNKSYKKAKKNKEELAKFKEEQLKNFIVIGAERNFPDDSQVVLHFPKGIKSASGIASAIDYDIKYQAITPFAAEFSCSRLSVNEACNPIEGMSLNFTNPVRAFDLDNVKLTSSKGQEWMANELSKESRKNLTKESELSYLTFSGPFPEKTELKLSLPKKLKDSLSRDLVSQNKFPLTLRTSEYSPLIKFNGRFGILEFVGGAQLPVSVRNIEKKILFDQSQIEGKALNLASMDQVKKIIDLYKRVQTKGEWPSEINDERNIPVLKKGEGKSFFIPKPNSEQEFEMMGIPLISPGFYAIEVKSPRLGAALTTTKKEMYVATTALVTNLAVHFKRGEESSLAWVTYLNNGSPVEGASISVRTCEGNELASGQTSKDGTLKLKGLSLFKKPNCKNYDNSLYVFAKKENDFSFVNSEWDKGIETYRYSVNRKYLGSENAYEDVMFHTVLDRVLFRPGETVSMQHFFREHHENGFSFLNKKDWPLNVYVVHAATGKTYVLPIVVDPKTSTALNTLKLPKDAILGKYEIYLSKKNISKKLPQNQNQKLESDFDENESNLSIRYDSQAKFTGSFTIAEYRLPLMQANVKIKGQDLVLPKTIEADVSAQYLSGGPAAKLNVKVRKQILSTYELPDFVGSEEYSFYSEKIKAGVVENVKSDEEEASASEDLLSKSLVLDKNGGEKVQFEIENKSSLPKRVQLEIEYTDPNGEIKSANNYKTIYPSKYAVGLKVDSWMSKPESTKVNGVVVDLENKKVSNVKYKIIGFKKQYYSHRKRLVGGFYSYDSKEEFLALGTICEGSTAEDGTFICEAKNLPAGYVFLEAEVVDEHSNPVYATAQVEIFDKGVDVWWSPGDSDRVDILPEKKMVDPGEVLKVMVKTPFKESTALVTIEREGVLDSFVTTLKRDNPVIEIPIKKNYVPNIFVSVTMVRGRIAEAKSDFLVDLNRPAIKMGLIPIKVGYKPHLISVNVTTPKKRYTTREKVDVTINLKKLNGEKLPSGSRVTLIAFDEALLLLKKNESFDILQTMMQERRLAVETSTGQNQIIGKRHFGSKAKAPGGGGGHGNDGSSRELFNSLLAYIPNIAVNEDGTASASITLNDSMTSFRIVAVATSGADLFGFNKTTIYSTKDLIIYSGAAPLARNNDVIQNVYTLRNTTDKEMKIEMNYQALLVNNSEVQKEEFSLLPSEARVFRFTTTIPENIKTLTYEVKASDLITKASDSIKTSIVVEKDLKAQVLQATLFQLDGTNTISVKEPKDSIKGSGGINLSFNKSLVNGLSGVKSYMEEYPYSCLEQQISKAIVLEDKKELSRIIKDMPSYFDQDGLLKFFTTGNSCGSEMLTVYALSILRENNISIPLNTKNQLISGLRSWLNGNLNCSNWWSQYYPKDYLDQQKIKILSELSFQNSPYTSMLESIKIDPNSWTTETNLAFKQLLTIDQKIPNRESHLSQVDNILKSRMNFQGSLMELQNKLNFSQSWSLFTSHDQEALLYFLDAEKNPIDPNDVGRMARGIVARLKKGTWDSTMSNAWGVTALRKFSEKFENIPMTGKTDVTFDNAKKQIDWGVVKGSNKIQFDWSKESKEFNDKEMPVNFKMEGTGKPWVSLQTLGAIPLKAPLDLGYLITKNISAISRKSPDKWTVGDVINVDVIIKANSDQSWVAINDPIPAGASHLGTGLEGESTILDRNKSLGKDGIAMFPEEFSEKKFSGQISYSAYLPRGTYKMSYRYRLNSAGKFKLPNTRVEALYAPEVFGESPNLDMTVSAE